MTNVGARKPPDHGAVVATIVADVEGRSRPFLLASVLRVEVASLHWPGNAYDAYDVVHFLSCDDKVLWPVEGNRENVTIYSPVRREIDPSKLLPLLRYVSDRRPRRIDASRLAPDAP